MPAEQNLVPSTAEVEQANEVTKDLPLRQGIRPLDLRSGGRGAPEEPPST